MNNKLIVIEGTDCSGKQTQTELLIKRLNELGITSNKFGFPVYDSPTGIIVGRDYLGKPQMGEGIFKEGAANVDPKVASLFYVADRKYNLNRIEELLKQGNLVLDRYSYSNFGHQASKFPNKKERRKMFKWLYNLEFKVMELPKPQIKVLLFMPYESACELKKHREEKADQHESSPQHLLNAEKTYLELAKIYKFKIINCVSNGQIRSIDDINNELLKYVVSKIK